MADLLNENGLQIKTLQEIVDDLEAGLRSIYGADINLDQNSPDGQMVGIFAQAAYDLRELAVTVNAFFDPDQALGAILDQRVALNNIARGGGTFTTVGITIIVDRTVDLQGLDENYNDLDATGFTVQDDAGNQFILVDSVTLTAGTHTLNFRAKELGAVLTTIATITNQTTIVLGVVSVNNASAALEVGQDEETDAALRVRRQKSVALASFGYLNGLEGAILNLDGVSDAKIYENVTNVTDADGIPAHGVWVIVEGGANSDIANLIYSKKSYGANMKGGVEINITTASGGVFTAKFDRPTADNLYIRFDIQPLESSASFNLTAIKAAVANDLVYKIGESAETATVTAAALTAINSLGGGGVPVNVEISDDGITWVDYLVTATKDNQWTLSTSDISITEL
jgi:uncharacterized phage protein gp47/JayE